MKNAKIYIKRRICAVICVCLCILLCGCAAKEPEGAKTDAESRQIVVGFSQVGAESDWRNANTISMTEALSEENGYRLIIDDAQNKQERQITAIRNFIQMGVDYIVLAPTNEIGWDTVLTEAKNAGIPVIIVDRMIEVADESLYACWVGSDFHKEGRTAICYLSEIKTEELKIVHLQGNLGSSAQIGRTTALDEALTAHSDWHLIHREAGDFTQAKGQEIVEDLLSRGIDFNVIYSENDNMAFGAIDALRTHGLQPGKDVIIISFDAGHRALERTLSGEISFDMECNPLHGPRVSAIIQSIENGVQPPKLTFVNEESFSTDTLTEEILAGRPY